MKLSTETGTLRRRYNDKIAIDLIKEAGFDAIDYSFCYMLDQPEKDMLDADYLAKAHNLKAYIDKIGIACNQAHAPLDFRHWNKVDLSDEVYLRNVRAIEVASVLGAENIVFHSLGSVLNSEIDYFEYNINYLRSYIPYCEKFNIHISVENLNAGDSDGNPIGIKGLTTPQEHILYLKKLDSEWFNICVDTGHSAITGIEPEDMISAMDNKILKALHIHDNNRLKDQHLLPYEGNLNWGNIAKALKKIDYRGDFTLEAINFYSNVSDEMMLDMLKIVAETGRTIIKKIN